MTTAGRKDDHGKLRWHLLSLKLLEPVVRVLMHGEGHYDAYNWQRVDNATERYSNALMRHWTAHQGGEKADPETGESHLAHVATNVLFLLYFELKEKEPSSARGH